MILLTLAVYGLLWIVYFAAPGRKMGGTLLLATVLMPVALLGALAVDARIVGNRMVAEIRESMYSSLFMGWEESNIGDSLGERVETSRSRIGDIDTVGYVFDGRYILIFQNGKLVSKSRK